MKKLTALLFTGLLGVSIFAQELPKNLGIPERFENYREGKRFPCENFYLGDYLMHAHAYDIDGDNYPDVSELYPVSGFDGANFIISEYPLLYGFDINRDGRYDMKEILIDKKMDGLNGNEEWLNGKPNTIGI